MPVCVESKVGLLHQPAYAAFRIKAGLFCIFLLLCRLKIKQIFDIAFRSLHRGIVKAENAKTILFCHMNDGFDHLDMCLLVFDNPFFSDLVTPRFKLRFDQADSITAFL